MAGVKCSVNLRQLLRLHWNGIKLLNNNNFDIFVSAGVTNKVSTSNHSEGTFMRSFSFKSTDKSTDESPRLREFHRKLRERAPIEKLEELEEGNHPYQEKEPLQPFPDNTNPKTGEVGGPRGPEPTRYGDWERKGTFLLKMKENLTSLKNKQDSPRMKQFHEKLKLEPIPKIGHRERFVDLVLVETDSKTGELITNSEKEPTKWGDWQNGGRVSDF